MLKDIVIIGAGGVGRETAIIIEDINKVNKEWNLLGFVDDNENIQNTYINGYKVLGKLEYLKNYKNTVYVVCAIANYKIKKMITEKLKQNENIHFTTLIHPNSKLHRTTTIGDGCIVYKNVTATANIKIGNHVIISPNTGIGHDSNIEDYSNILWGTNISGNVHIKEGNLIGSGATIIQGLTIGKNSTIGAGTVVIRDIPDNVTAVGNPARVLLR